MSELLEKILSRNNMNEAYKRVKAKNGAGGVDDMEIEDLPKYNKLLFFKLNENGNERHRRSFAYAASCNHLEAMESTV